jgi:hypothetical protein
VSAARRPASPGVERACYRFGDSFVTIDSDYTPLLRTFELWYGECAVSGPPRSDVEFHCSVRQLDDTPLILLSFRVPQGPAAEGAALAVFQSLGRGTNHVVDCPASGWRLMFRSADTTRPFMAMRGFDALVDLREEPPGLPPGLLLNYIVSAVMSVQRDVLHIHAASVAIGRSAALFMGIGGAGKTTLSLTLASRGHLILGDNQACVRIKSREVLPFRRSASIKPGPRARAISELLTEQPGAPIRLPDGRAVTLMRIGNYFESADTRALPLGALFYLRSIGEHPTLEPFSPAMTNQAFLSRLASDSTAVFGVSPSWRLMNVMILMDILSGVPCFFLDAGRPEETAALVEQTMETL